MTVVPELGTTVGEALLAVHRSYLKAVGAAPGRARAGDGASRTSRAAESPTTCRGSSRHGVGARIDRGSWDGAAALPSSCGKPVACQPMTCTVRSTWGSG